MRSLVLSHTLSIIPSIDLAHTDSRPPLARLRARALSRRCARVSACTDLHTVVAHAAVGAARRPVEVAGGAPLHPHLDALHVHVLVERRPELVVLVLVVVGWKTTGGIVGSRHVNDRAPALWLLTHWQHTSIHKGRHGKVGQHKEEEDGAAWRHRGADGRGQPRASEHTNREIKNQKRKLVKAPAPLNGWR